MPASLDDVLNDALQIVPHTDRRDPQRPDTLLRAPIIPSLVALGIVAERMGKAIDFNCQAGLKAEEIENERS